MKFGHLERGPTTPGLGDFLPADLESVYPAGGDFPWRIHGTNGIFIYIYHEYQPNVGKYTSPMDGVGWFDFLKFD